MVTTFLPNLIFFCIWTYRPKTLYILSHEHVYKFTKYQDTHTNCFGDIYKYMRGWGGGMENTSPQAKQNKFRWKIPPLSDSFPLPIYFLVYIYPIKIDIISKEEKLFNAQLRNSIIIFFQNKQLMT